MTLSEAKKYIVLLKEQYPEKLFSLGIGDLDISNKILEETIYISEQCYLGTPNSSEKEMFERTLIKLIKERTLNEKQN